MLHNAIKNSLEQVLLVVSIIENLPKKQMTELYAEMSIGRHVRHITDHFLALKNGISNAVVDYNQRNRNSIIETDIPSAKVLIAELIDWMETSSTKTQLLLKPIKVYSEIDCFQTVNYSFSSYGEREFLYLINHTIHHIAYIKLLAKTKNVNLPEYIGIAPSTATFLQCEEDCEQLKIQNEESSGIEVRNRPEGTKTLEPLNFVHA